jgi:SAM-dependent MidA family methyltransferase
MTPVESLVRSAIERRGPVPFAEVMSLALYQPEHGFYATVGRAGRRGDFLTSPEVGPLFGAVVARALDEWWVEAGEPEVFPVVEAGAGPGTLASSVIAAAPRCSRALRYVLVEVSERQRADHATGLELHPPAFAFAGTPDPDEEDEPAVVATGPIVVSLTELPRVGGPCVVLANELLDNLPVQLYERTSRGWGEVRVAMDGDRLIDVVLPGSSAGGRDAPLGARIPVAHAAAWWVRDAVELAGSGGRVVAIDYTSTTDEMARRPWLEWMRTYRGHEPGGHPLERLGEQDITCEVAVDQLPPPARDVSQAGWLRAHHIDELVEEGREVWRERAAIGDLEAIKARSRVTEAEALLDPNGLGAFRVLEWDGR